MPDSRISPEEPLNGRLASNVRHFRESFGLTYAELAERVGASPSTIQKLENRKIPNPGIRTLRALADMFGVQLERLLDEDLSTLDPLEQTVYWLTNSFPREAVEHYVIAVRATLLEMSRHGAFHPPSVGPANRESVETA